MKKLRPRLFAARRALPACMLCAVFLAHASMREAPALMAAVATRELPVYNVDTEEKVLSISFDAAWKKF